MSAAPRPSLAAVVLAAGASRRMGTAKAALPLGGTTFLARVLAGLHAASLAPIVVVAGTHRAAVRAAMPARRAADLVVNATPERGQLSSLKVGLRHLLATAPAATGAVVALVDHPVVAPATVALLADAAREAGPAIVVPTHEGRRGHPIVLMRAVWDEVLATPDDATTRAVVRRDPDRVRELAVADPGVLVDVDTPGDAAALTSSRRASGAPRRARSGAIPAR